MDIPEPPHAAHEPGAPGDLLRRPPPPQDWRERMSALLGGDWSWWRAAAVLILVAGIGIAGWALLRPPPTPPPPELSLPMAGRTASTGGPTGDGEAGGEPGASTTTTSGGVVVHAAGAVQAPGLYQLPIGARVADLLAAAGGPAPDADTAGVNLAAPLADGQRWYVPRLGETTPPELTPSASASPGGPAGGGPRSGPLDLNTATADQLDALPGVGPSTAEAILSYREQHGAFRSVEELLDVRGIGPARFEQLRELVTV